MDAQTILNILCRQKSKTDIIRAIEILCNPDMKPTQSIQAYNRYEAKKRNRITNQNFTTLRVK